LRDGDTAWVLAQGDTLATRLITIAWQDMDAAYVSTGLEDGDRLIVSDIPAPVEGMQLVTAETASRKEVSAPEATGGTR
jgi:hypothetical protein